MARTNVFGDVPIRPLSSPHEIPEVDLFIDGRIVDLGFRGRKAMHAALVLARRASTDVIEDESRSDGDRAHALLRRDTLDLLIMYFRGGYSRRASARKSQSREVPSDGDGPAITKESTR